MGNCSGCCDEDEDLTYITDAVDASVFSESDDVESRPPLQIATDSSRDGTNEGEAERKNYLQMLKRQSMMIHLPCREYKDNTKTECTICMEYFEAGHMVRSLPCFHSFHQTCIDDWLSRSFTCPTCMEPVSSALLMSFDLH